MPVTPSAELTMVEIFSSLQGEGPLVGRRQIFLRLAGCNLDCDYCDTPFAPTAQCLVESPVAAETIEPWTNPVAAARVVALAADWLKLLPRAHHSFSITGGEPLLQATMLRQWLPELSALLPVQLETNGTLPEPLQLLLPWLRWVVMDFKLASQTKIATPWATHRQFLEIAAAVNCSVKLVVGSATPDAELQQAAEIIAAVAPQVAVILQPRTSGGRCSVAGTQLLKWQALLAAFGLDVRVIPQTHCFIAVR